MEGGELGAEKRGDVGGRWGRNRGQRGPKKKKKKRKGRIETIKRWNRGKKGKGMVSRCAAAAGTREHVQWAGRCVSQSICILSNPHPPEVSIIMSILQMR